MPPRLARLLAVIGVIVLIAGAFALRSALSGDDDEVTAGGPPAEDDEDPRPDGTFDVLCDQDLGDAVCDVIKASERVDEVKVVRRDTVVDLLLGDEGDKWDAWLTLDPMPAVLDTTLSQMNRAGRTDPADSVPVASGELAVLTFASTPLTCLGSAATWECLTQEVTPAVAVASLRTSVGAVTAAAGAAGLMGTVDFDIRRFAESPGGDLLDDLVDDVPRAAGITTAQQTVATFSPGVTSAVVTTSDLADLRVDTAQGRGRSLRTVRLGPTVRVGVVLAGLGERSSDATRALEDLVTSQTVRTALADAGWAGEPLPSEGLPDGPLTYAIIEELS